MKHEHHESHRGGSPAGTAIDPVCGMTVKIEGARHTQRHGTGTQYFCSARCREKFTADPERYLDAARAVESEAKAQPQATLYTCPMHPEVVQVGPGNCPKCGMALEPKGIPPAARALIRNSSTSCIACGSALPSPSRSWSSPWGRTLAFLCIAGFRRKLRAGSN